MRITVYYAYNNVKEENLINSGFSNINISEEKQTTPHNRRKYIKEKDGYTLIFTLIEGLHNKLECITTNKNIEKNISFMFSKNSKFNSIELMFEEKPNINLKDWKKQGDLPLYEHKNMEKLYFYNKENSCLVDMGAESPKRFTERYNQLNIKG